jgi:hypothetical protein
MHASKINPTKIAVGLCMSKLFVFTVYLLQVCRQCGGCSSAPTWSAFQAWAGGV